MFWFMVDAIDSYRMPAHMMCVLRSMQPVVIADHFEAGLLE